MRELEIVSTKDIRISITKAELYILRAIVSEIYSWDCLDTRQFEIIHWINIKSIPEFSKEIVENLEHKLNLLAHRVFKSKIKIQPKESYTDILDYYIDSLI